MEASLDDSEVCVRVRSIQRRDRVGARVTIHDHGRGIPDDIKERTFDPFFTTKDLKGSGLGLWVSRSLIAKHHGTIRFRSSQREGASGTTFEVFLPVGGLHPTAWLSAPRNTPPLSPARPDRLPTHIPTTELNPWQSALKFLLLLRR